MTAGFQGPLPLHIIHSIRLQLGEYRIIIPWRQLHMQQHRGNYETRMWPRYLHFLEKIKQTPSWSQGPWYVLPRSPEESNNLKLKNVRLIPKPRLKQTKAFQGIWKTVCIDNFVADHQVHAPKTLMHAQRRFHTTKSCRLGNLFHTVCNKECLWRRTPILI